MRANEFRLGSFFGYKGCIYAANVIRDNFVYGKNVNGFAPGEFPLDKINPIPLTEEWLLKFGFKRFPWGLVKDNLLFKDDLKCSYLVLQVGNGFEVKIKYVHELQNLYFALTGQELILNEKL